VPAGSQSSEAAARARGRFDRPERRRLPVVVGTGVTEVEGCAADREPGLGMADRHPPQSGPSAPPPKIAAIPGGILVEHALTHACCLTAKGETTLEGGTVRVIHGLEGEPCRCACSSLIRTVVRADPGMYLLNLDTGPSGRQHRVVQMQVSVVEPAPGLPAPPGDGAAPPESPGR
jgi:hypothetical protein